MNLGDRLTKIISGVLIITILHSVIPSEAYAQLKITKKQSEKINLQNNNAARKAVNSISVITDAKSLTNGPQSVKGLIGREISEELGKVWGKSFAVESVRVERVYEEERVKIAIESGSRERRVYEVMGEDYYKALEYFAEQGGVRLGYGNDVEGESVEEGGLLNSADRVYSAYKRTLQNSDSRKVGKGVIELRYDLIRKDSRKKLEMDIDEATGAMLKVLVDILLYSKRGIQERYAPLVTEVLVGMRRLDLGGKTAGSMRAYYKEVLDVKKSKGVCESRITDGYVRGLGEAQKSCIDITSAMTGLGLIGGGEEEIYKFGKEYWSEGRVSSVIMSRAAHGLILSGEKGIVLLGELIRETVRSGYPRNAVKWAWDKFGAVFTPSEYVDGYYNHVSKKALYLNEVTRRFEYIDEEKAREWGFSVRDIKMCQEVEVKRGSDACLMMPMRNVFTDIGEDLAYLGGAGGKREIRKLLREERNLHWPFIVGVLGSGAYEGDGGANEIRKVIAGTTYMDVTSGTDRKIKEAVGLKIGGFNADQLKRAREYYNEKRLAYVLDIVVMIALIGNLAKSMSTFRVPRSVENCWRSLRGAGNAGKEVSVRGVRSVKVAEQAAAMERVNAVKKVSGGVKGGVIEFGLEGVGGELKVVKGRIGGKLKISPVLEGTLKVETKVKDLGLSVGGSGGGGTFSARPVVGKGIIEGGKGISLESKVTGAFRVMEGNKVAGGVVEGEKVIVAARGTGSGVGRIGRVMGRAKNSFVHAKNKAVVYSMMVMLPMGSMTEAGSAVKNISNVGKQISVMAEAGGVGVRTIEGGKLIRGVIAAGEVSKAMRSAEVVSGVSKGLDRAGRIGKASKLGGIGAKRVGDTAKLFGIGSIIGRPAEAEGGSGPSSGTLERVYAQLVGVRAPVSKEVSTKEFIKQELINMSGIGFVAMLAEELKIGREIRREYGKEGITAESMKKQWAAVEMTRAEAVLDRAVEEGRELTDLENSAVAGYISNIHVNNQGYVEGEKGEWSLSNTPIAKAADDYIKNKYGYEYKQDVESYKRVNGEGKEETVSRIINKRVEKITPAQEALEGTAAEPGTQMHHEIPSVLGVRPAAAVRREALPVAAPNIRENGFFKPATERIGINVLASFGNWGFIAEKTVDIVKSGVEKIKSNSRKNLTKALIYVLTFGVAMPHSTNPMILPSRRDEEIAAVAAQRRSEDKHDEMIFTGWAEEVGQTLSFPESGTGVSRSLENVREITQREMNNIVVNTVQKTGHTKTVKNVSNNKIFNLLLKRFTKITVIDSSEDIVVPQVAAPDTLSSTAGRMWIRGNITLGSGANKVKISVYDKGEKAVITLKTDKKIKLNSERNEMLYVNAKGELIIRSNKRGAQIEKVLINTSLVLNENGRISANKDFARELNEGVGLVNNKLAPLFGLFVIAGFGALATSTASLVVDAFNVEGYMGAVIQSVGYAVPTFMSVKIAKQTLNNSLRKMVNWGLAISLGAMTLPMFFGFFGHLPNSLEIWKLVPLGVSMLALGFGITTLEVASKPLFQASSSVGRYRTNVADAGFVKQVVGSIIGAGVVPLAKSMGFDWSFLFPTYAVLTIMGLIAFNKWKTNTRTLGNVVNASAEPVKTKVSAMELFKKDPLVKNAYFTFAAHMWLMSTVGFQFNLIAFDAVGYTYGLALATGAFTAPMMVSRYFVGKKLGNKSPSIISNIVKKSSMFSLAGLLLVQVPYLPINVLGMAVTGWGVATISPVVQAYVTDVREKYAVQVSGILSSTTIGSMIGVVASAVVGSYLVIGDLKTAFLIPTFLTWVIWSFGNKVAKGKFEENFTIKKEQNNNNVLMSDPLLGLGKNFIGKDNNPALLNNLGQSIKKLWDNSIGLRRRAAAFAISLGLLIPQAGADIFESNSVIISLRKETLTPFVLERRKSEEDKYTELFFDSSQNLPYGTINLNNEAYVATSTALDNIDNAPKAKTITSTVVNSEAVELIVSKTIYKNTRVNGAYHDEITSLANVIEKEAVNKYFENKRKTSGIFNKVKNVFNGSTKDFNNRLYENIFTTSFISNVNKSDLPANVKDNLMISFDEVFSTVKISAPARMPDEEDFYGLPAFDNSNGYTKNVALFSKAGDNEIQLPVNMSVSGSLNIKKGEKVVVTEKGKIHFKSSFKEYSPDFFFIKTQSENLKKIIDKVAKSENKTRIKLEREGKTWILLKRDIKRTERPIYHQQGESLVKLPVAFEVDNNIVVRNNEKLIIDDNSVLYAQTEDGKVRTITDFYVRLPKEFALSWADIFGSAEGVDVKDYMDLTVKANYNKILPLYSAALITSNPSTAVIGDIKHSMHLPEYLAQMIPFFSYISAMFNVFLNPFIKIYGKVKVLNVALGVTGLSFVGMVAAGFYGQASLGLEPASWRLAIMASSLLLAGVAGSWGSSVTYPLVKENSETTEIAGSRMAGLQLFRSFGAMAFLLVPVALATGVNALDIGFLDFSMSYPMFLAGTAVTIAMLRKSKLKNIKDQTMPEQIAKMQGQTYLKIIPKGSVAGLGFQGAKHIWDTLKTQKSIQRVFWAASLFTGSEIATRAGASSLIKGSLVKLAGTGQANTMLDSGIIFLQRFLDGGTLSLALTMLVNYMPAILVRTKIKQLIQTKVLTSNDVLVLAGGFAGAGLLVFAFNGFSLLGLTGVMINVVGTCSFFSQLQNTTMDNHSKKWHDSIANVLGVTLIGGAVISPIMGAVSTVSGSMMTGLLVPAAALIGAVVLLVPEMKKSNIMTAFATRKSRKQSISLELLKDFKNKVGIYNWVTNYLKSNEGAAYFPLYAMRLKEELVTNQKYLEERGVDFSYFEDIDLSFIKNNRPMHGNSGYLSMGGLNPDSIEKAGKALANFFKALYFLVFPAKHKPNVISYKDSKIKDALFAFNASESSLTGFVFEYDGKVYGLTTAHGAYLTPEEFIISAFNGENYTVKKLLTGNSRLYYETSVVEGTQDWTLLEIPQEALTAFKPLKVSEKKVRRGEVLAGEGVIDEKFFGVDNIIVKHVAKDNLVYTHNFTNSDGKHVRGNGFCGSPVFRLNPVTNEYEVVAIHNGSSNDRSYSYAVNMQAVLSAIDKNILKKNDKQKFLIVSKDALQKPVSTPVDKFITLSDIEQVNTQSLSLGLKIKRALKLSYSSNPFVFASKLTARIYKHLKMKVLKKYQRMVNPREARPRILPSNHKHIVLDKNNAPYSESIFYIGDRRASGVVVKHNGKIFGLIAAHTEDGLSKIIHIVSADKQAFKARVVAAGKSKTLKAGYPDISVLELSGDALKKFVPLELSAENILENEEVYSIGFLRGFRLLPIINRKVLAVDEAKYITTPVFGKDATGYCGSALIKDGKLAGLHKGSYSDGLNSIAVKASVISDFLEFLETGKDAGYKISLADGGIYKIPFSKVTKKSKLYSNLEKTSGLAAAKTALPYKNMAMSVRNSYKKLVFSVESDIIKAVKEAESPRSVALKDMKYTQSIFRMPGGGSGFLVTHKGRTFGIADAVLSSKLSDFYEITDINNKKHYSMSVLIERYNAAQMGRPGFPFDYNNKVILDIMQEDNSINALKFASSPAKEGDILYSLGFLDNGETYAVDNIITQESKGNNFFFSTPFTADKKDVKLFAGAPLLNKQGEVVGVYGGIYKDEDGNERHYSLGLKKLKELFIFVSSQFQPEKYSSSKKNRKNNSDDEDAPAHGPNVQKAKQANLAVKPQKTQANALSAEDAALLEKTHDILQRRRNGENVTLAHREEYDNIIADLQNKPMTAKEREKIYSVKYFMTKLFIGSKHNHPAFSRGFQPSVVPAEDIKYKKSFFYVPSTGVTGTVIEYKGQVYAITVAHATVNMNRENLQMQTSDKKMYTAEFVNYFINEDILLYKLSPEARAYFKPLPVYNGNIEELQKLYTVGYLRGHLYASDNRYVLKNDGNELITTFNFTGGKNGFCGAPLIIEDPVTGKPYLAGMHTGSFGRSESNAVAPKVIKEILEKAAGK
ncbi:hypothetical protein Emin_0664 [Elusimicrobium minutum Pei191]|uniref:Uncharacterized protein n=1 Tax=Elusimicrobium minutum (strain Pei191) TaxID=445932 RepID=B2KC92_ELUMP|nr:MFS transporter [Elusimicrobium minutum]ACC98219.1 hypothetical protein Emin_0664 [Elusimicrobium minutum Pei191]